MRIVKHTHRIFWYHQVYALLRLFGMCTMYIHTIRNVGICSLFKKLDKKKMDCYRKSASSTVAVP